ncbi:hypothetical protein JCM8097_008256 [Rhodosporidiobolus ruineniae]
MTTTLLEEPQTAGVLSLTAAAENLDLSSSDETDPDWLVHFKKHGYAVVPDVITKEKAKGYISDWHSWLERYPLGYDRDDRSTWTADHLPSNFNEPKVLEAFQAVWKTERLIVSFDSPNISHPVSSHGRTDIDPLPAWPHIDADPSAWEFELAQGFLNYEESGDDDGGLVLLSNSQYLHERFIAERGIVEAQREGRKEWYTYTPENVAWFQQNGAELIKVNVPAGALVLWDSRTVHWTRSPTGERTRVIQYLCYEPSSRLSPEQRTRKADLFHRRLTTTHTPHLGIAPQLLSGKPTRHGGGDPAFQGELPFIEPEITETVLRLAGVERYPGEEEEEAAEAKKRGGH